MIAQQAERLAEAERRHAEELEEAKGAFAEAERRNQMKLEELEERCKSNDARSQACFQALFKATGAIPP